MPHFLGIGAQKAATTWLGRNLRCHPELYLPCRTELHYFDRHFHRSLGFYSRKLAAGADRVRGEITPAYSILPVERIRFIHALIPSLRLIFLMRNPVDRAWSQALMRLSKRKRRPIEQIPEDELLEHLRRDSSRRLGDYAAILDRWLSVFPREQLYLAFFEDVAERPRELLGEVFAHLAVSRDVDWSRFPYGQVIHQGAGTPIPPRCREVLNEIYAAPIERLFERFGDRVAGWRVAPAGEPCLLREV
jgi:hypothetical protein